jgi:fibronectin-binding autotransporter adhesin
MAQITPFTIRGDLSGHSHTQELQTLVLLLLRPALLWEQLPATTNVNVTGAITAQTTGQTNTMKIGGAFAVTLASGATLTVDGILKSGANSATISGGTALTSAGAQLIARADATGDTLIVNTPITGAGVSLIKSGAGILQLGATGDAYGGETVVNAGTLKLGVANVIPDNSNVTLYTGSQLDLNNLSETIGSLSGTGTVTSTVAGTPTLTVGSGGGSSVFGGVINNGTGTGVALAKTGAGTLTLVNVTAGTFTGATTINGGAIKIATPNALANNTTINVNTANGLLFDTTVPVISGLGGNSAFALQTTATSPVPNAPVQLSVGNNNASATFSGALTGPGTLVKIGTGNQLLAGANTNTGGLVVNAGVLALSGNNSGASGSIFVNNGGVIQINAANAIYGATGQTIVVGNGGVVSAQAFTANPASTGIPSLAPLAIRVDPRSTGVVGLQVDNSLAAPVTENLDFSAVGLNLSLGAILSNAAGFGNAPVQYTGVITPNAGTFRIGGGNGRLILSNPATLAGANVLNIGGGGGATGQLFLTAAYPFTGATTINAGTTIVNNLKNGGAASPLGASSSAASNLVLNGGTLQYVGNGASTDRLFTLSTSPTALDASGSAPVNFTNTGAVAFVNGGNRTLTLQGTNTGTNTLAAAIGDSLAITAANAGVSNGTTSLQKNGNGTWVLSGTNTFSGGITINNGVLLFASAGAAGANTVNGPASVLVNAGGAAAIGPALTGFVQAALNRISPLSTGSIALSANTAESINFDGGASGAGVPQLTLGAVGNVTYTGALTPFGSTYRLGGGGGVLSMPNGGLTGPRQLIVAGGGPGTSFVNGPNLNGAVILGGSSDYSGGTVLATGGVLSATSLTALGTGPLKFQGGFYRATNATDITLASDGTSARDIRIGNESSNNVQTANIDVVAGVNLALSKTFGALAPVGSNYGQETLTKFGAGTLTLMNGVNLMNTNGSNNLASNSGTLTIERGTLTMLSNPTNFNGLIQVGSNNGGVGTLKLGANNVFANTTAQFGSASNIDVFTGSTIDLAGFSDTFRNIRSVGNIINTGGPGANLTVGTNNEVGVVGGNLVGNFTLTKGGQVTNVFGTGATISGFEVWNTNNSQFTGKFVINAGSMRFRADGSLGASNEPFAADKITINNNAVMISAGGTNLVIGANHGITLGAGGGTLWNFGTAAMIVNSPITGSGPLTIADDLGAIFLTNNANNWTGGTTINNNNTANRGVLVIGAAAQPVHCLRAMCCLTQPTPRQARVG